MDQQYLRNFSVIAHIDHGKTTLTDRLMELTGQVTRHQHQRMLDSHPIEQERGITIKLAPISLNYSLAAPLTTNHSELKTSSSSYMLNLIDTPGHIDFNYEVERSLAACEGALLLVDATQGIQAQTIGNLNLARKQNLTIIPIINKIDLPQAQSAEVQAAIGKLLPDADSPLLLSAKTGANVDQLLPLIVNSIPAPSGQPDLPLRALVFNSLYHPHLGVIAFVRIVDGQLLQHQKLTLLVANHSFTPQEIGIFTPGMSPTAVLSTGQVGYIATGLKDISIVQVGDTLATINTQPVPLPGYRHIRPNVYLDIYPIDTSQYKALLAAVDKIKLHDAALTTSPASSPSLGHGLQVGFLGLLHADIFRERLERDFDLGITMTAPSVEYRLILNNGEELNITRPSDFPDPSSIKTSYEPIALTTIITPATYVGPLIQLLEELRGTMINTKYLSDQTVELTYHLPLIEVITHLHDTVKSISSGFASVDYRLDGDQPANLIKLAVDLNHEPIEPLARLEVSQKADTTARRMAAQLKDSIPRHQFEIPIQIRNGGTVIARETVKSFRKDVTAKLYGGDRTRRMKLLEKQKKGKEKLKSFGSVNLPPEVFRLNV